MKDLNYKFLGRESLTWQKKYFFQEVGRGGNPDSAFMVLLVSGRVRSVESSAALGSAVYAKLVNQYGQTHLSDGPREMVKRLVDIVNAEAAEAKQTRTELAAGFLFFKGRRAAAGSVGRLRAGFADRDTLIVTSPLPERARQKGNEGQVSLDLGHTVEGDTKETPAFFIVPSGAMAMGDEHMRKFLWDFVSDELGMRDRAPAGWEHLPCLVGAAADLEVPAACGTKKKRKEKAAASRSRQSAPAGGLLTGSASRGAPGPLAGHRKQSRGIDTAVRPVLWVGLVALLAFLGIKYVFSGRDDRGMAVPDGMTAAPAGFAAEESRAEETVGYTGGPAEETVPVESVVESVGGVPSPVAKSLWRSDLGGVITSSPVDLGGAVAFGSRNGSVYCLSKESGKVRWKYDGPDGFGSSPAAAGGKIFIGCYDGGVLCLSARDGSSLWRYNTGGRVVCSPVLTPGGEVLIGSYDGFLYCLSSEGKLKWRFNSGARVWSSPLYSDGKVFFGDLEGRLHCLDASNGKHKWSKTAPGAIYSSPAAGGGNVYFGSSDGTVAAYRSADGTRMWFYKGPGEVTSSIGMISGALVVGFKNGTLTKLAPEEGTKLWAVVLAGAVRSRPVEWDGRIAVTCYDGHVRILDISDGSTQLDYDAGGKVFATPLVSSEIVYFGDMSGKFTALDFAASTRQ